MNESYYVCKDMLGNRAVILCGEGYPICGILLPSGSKGNLASDKRLLAEAKPPLGGMMLDTVTCISIMEDNDGVIVRDNGFECDWELSDEEKGYLSAR